MSIRLGRVNPNRLPVLMHRCLIAGDDRKWVWADARIEGDTVVVSSPSVPNLTQVRYAWQSNPAATLFNGAGLPAAPFRTDSWPGNTENQRPY